MIEALLVTVKQLIRFVGDIDRAILDAKSGIPPQSSPLAVRGAKIRQFYAQRDDAADLAFVKI